VNEQRKAVNEDMDDTRLSVDVGVRIKSANKTAPATTVQQQRHSSENQVSQLAKQQQQRQYSSNIVVSQLVSQQNSNSNSNIVVRIKSACW
jgi:hypothetical protein